MELLGNWSDKMNSPELREYPTIERFNDALDILEKFTTLILFEFGKKAEKLKDINNTKFYCERNSMFERHYEVVGSPRLP